MKIKNLLLYCMMLASFWKLQSQSVVDIIVNSPNHNTLEAAVRAANLVDALNGDGPFTVFAPTDAAFAALPPGTVDALLQDPSGALKNILLYHVANASALSSDLTNGQKVISLYNGKSVTVNINSNGVFINNAKVTVADIVADNGIVHVINAVLLPNNTVADIIINSPVHNTLEVAVKAANLVDALNGAGPFTVFAPTDAAFAALPAGTIDALLQDPSGVLTRILLYHVAGVKALSTDLTNGQKVITLYNGKSVIVTINANGVFINNAKVSVADVQADNGVVHVIDAVLLPNNTVADIIINSPVHNTLEVAVKAANLVDALSGAGPFTVFAPTDAAFAALPAGTIDALLQDPSGALTRILLYHVAGAKALSTDLTNGQKVITLYNGKSVTVTINANGVFINNAKVSVADVQADNGVVHVIDAVLLPNNTVADIIINSPVHNTLEVAVKAANLVDALSGPGPFTVFAPTDAAFAALPAGTIDALLQDPSGALTRILLYHVAGAKALSTDLTNGQKVITLYNGKSVTVTINANGVFINNAKVSVADVQADNGVVHVIDAVLLPNNTVADIIINSPVHNTLEVAVKAANLVDALNGAGPFTVFAPTDAAFAALPAGTIDALLQDPSGALTQILLYHAVGGKALSSDLSNGQQLITLNSGKVLNVRINSDGVFINRAKVIVANIEADNGVVHVIDAVLTELISSSKDENPLESTKAWPNPFSEIIEFETEGNSNSVYEVSLFNTAGQMVWNQKFSANQGTITENFKPGVYILEIKNEESRKHFKMVKN